ncbi:unnamed protein product [Aspergillus oryzae]|uniref:Unnamed protein product n=1 Tax=Aspergillus oryzae var. brunneus TaxID=332754 RepID=A0ABQ6KN30_ASPOZ|nr:unnamed protein product [Aspergillus oryzae]GMG09182.1 unnamed protein product [Aspergillus oryzae]GMG45353.1 unnamed protein product [Aspergillus oryzae var. brunneus]
MAFVAVSENSRYVSGLTWVKKPLKNASFNWLRRASFPNLNTIVATDPDAICMSFGELSRCITKKSTRGSSPLLWMGSVTLQGCEDVRQFRKLNDIKKQQ